jgi:hypothetical protein
MKITNWTRNAAIAIASRKGVKNLNRFVAGAVVGGVLVLNGAAADAAPLNHSIDEASFDDMTLGSSNYAYISSLSGYPWTSTSNSWLYNSDYAAGSTQQPTPLSAPNAVHLADGNIYQVIGDAFVSGRSYALSAWIHYDIDPFVGDNFGLRLFDGTSGTFAGAQVFASQDYILGTDFQDDGNWQQMTLSFTAGASADGKPIGIYLGPEAQANRISVDDVTLTSIPEPGSVALWGAGAGSVVLWQLVRRRRSEENQA